MNKITKLGYVAAIMLGLTSRAMAGLPHLSEDLFSANTASTLSDAEHASTRFQQVYYFEGLLDADRARQLTSLGQAAGLVLNLGDPPAHELSRLATVRSISGIILDVTRNMTIGWVQPLKQSSSHLKEMIFIDSSLPTAQEVEWLNQTGLRQLRWVLTHYPAEEEMARMTDLKAKVALTFVTSFLPRGEEVPAFQALRSDAEILFVTDYWPWYSHMDNLNRMPQTQFSFRIIESFPSVDHLNYLRNIRALKKVQLQTSYDVQDARVWTDLHDLPVDWIVQDWVPSTQALQIFVQSRNPHSERRLIVSQERAILDFERTRLQQSDLDTTVIHEPPPLTLNL